MTTATKPAARAQQPGAKPKRHAGLTSPIQGTYGRRHRMLAPLGSATRGDTWGQPGQAPYTPPHGTYAGTELQRNPGIHAVRAVLEDYQAALETLPARTMVRCPCSRQHPSRRCRSQTNLEHLQPAIRPLCAA